MSELRDDPELMLHVIAKLVHRAGGYAKLTVEDHPSGPFKLASRTDKEGRILELRLLDISEGTA